MSFLLTVLLIAPANAIRIIPKSQYGSGSQALVNIPLNGPCTLNNEHAYKCTAAGYYETVQCDDLGCFCVDARNGATAEGTRTSDNRKAPECSKCHNYLKSLFADGEPAKNSFIPRCDRDLGYFEQLQCTGDFCFCVESTTGKEIPGTKKKRDGNFILRCDDKGVVATSVPKTQADGQILPVGRDYCRLDRDRGYTCSEKQRRIMFYFDSTTFDCLAFEHKGCAGNDNRFYSRLDCEATCLLNDFVACSGLSTPAKNSRGSPIVCGGTIPDAPRGSGSVDTCPADYTCVMGPFFGFCCRKEIEDKYAKAYRPKCLRGAVAQVRRRDGKSDPLLGKSCDDEFCPSGYHCVQADPFAFCCP